MNSYIILGCVLMAVCVSTTPLNNEKTLTSDFYGSCGSKTCFGSPAGCLETKDCESMVAISRTTDNTSTVFELLVDHADAKWVSVCLSSDQKMSDDNCLDCIYDGKHVLAFVSRTTASSQDEDVVRETKQSDIQLVSGIAENGQIYCKVNRKSIGSMDSGATYNLITDQYYLLLAAGKQLSGTLTKEHDLEFRSSDVKSTLDDKEAYSSGFKSIISFSGFLLCTLFVLSIN